MEPESFEKTDYGHEGSDEYDKLAAIKQVASEIVKANPHHGFLVEFVEGDKLKVTYVTMEVSLPSKITAVQEQARKLMSEFIKTLKADFRKKTKKTLTLKELKDRQDYAVEKVSLNERYYFRQWNIYEIG